MCLSVDAPESYGPGCTFSRATGGDMTHVHEPFLAEALVALLRDRRVSVSHVVKYSGLVRTTIVYILTGKTTHPGRATLHQIAVALSTDPGTGELDRRIMTETERVLAVAAGDADPTARETRSLLELSLYYQLNSRERARAWAEIIETLGDLPPETVRTLAPLE